MKISNARLLLLTGAILIIAYILHPIAISIWNANKPGRNTPSIKLHNINTKGVFDKSLLSHRLIKYDEEQGVSSSTVANNAYYQVSLFLDEVKSKCPKDAHNIDFLHCASEILGKHFYYKSSAAVSPAWAAGYSDCDLNSYLLLDATRIAGKDAEIVYAPHHAFISVRGESSGQRFYWETTARNNHGLLADMTDGLYQKNFHPFYYTPVPASAAESLYPVLVLDGEPQEKIIKILNQYAKTSPDNPIASDVFYYTKTSLSENDIVKIKGLLQTDISSSMKKIALVRHYTKSKEINLAAYYLSKIDDEICTSECLNLSAELPFNQSFLPKIIIFADKHGLKVTLKNLKLALWNSFTRFVECILIVMSVMCIILLTKGREEKAHLPQDSHSAVPAGQDDKGSTP